jgi:hypothetical protein
MLSHHDVVVACDHRRNHGAVPHIGPPGLALGPAGQRICLTANKHNSARLSALYQVREKPACTWDVFASELINW